VFASIVVFFSGFATFFPGNFTASGFLSNYIACFVVPTLYAILKITMKAPWVKYEDMDFSEMDAIREEKALRDATATPPRGLWRRILEKVVDE
jgi:amino acid transporter